MIKINEFNDVAKEIKRAENRRKNASYSTNPQTNYTSVCLANAAYANAHGEIEHAAKAFLMALKIIN